MRNFRFFAVGVASWLVLAIAPPAAAQIDDADATALRELIDGLIDEGDPGYAVGIVVDDEVVFTHYSGLAILDTPTPIDENTRFNIASVTKQYTALMVLALAEDGKVDLKEDFRTYLQDSMPEIKERITVAHLLTHTSGIRDVYDLFFLTNQTWFETDFSNRDARRLLNAQTGLNFPPGSEHLYSNSNYILLANLISEVTGEPFPAYAKAFLAERGMENTSARRRFGSIIPNKARSYGNYGSGWLQDPDIANTYGDGFIFTTLIDQLHWEKQIWGHGQTLPADLIARSQRPLASVPYKDYGFGLFFGSYRGLETVYHEGATLSFNSHTLRFPELKTSIITMGNTNQINAVGLAMRVAEEFLSDHFPTNQKYLDRPNTDRKFTSIVDFLGTYELDSGTFLTLARRDGELFREIAGSDPVRMVPEAGKGVFSYETIPTLKLYLTMKGDGQPEIGLYSSEQAPQLGRFVDFQPTPKDPDYFASVEGSYFNEETDTEIILEHAERNQFTMVKNKRPRTLELIAKDYLIWNSYRITVVRDRGGNATGLSVDRGRIKNVAFVRTDEIEGRN